jgi:hypothetical protein
MVCPWVTILRARRNLKVYGWYEQSDLRTNHVLVFVSPFMVMVMVTATPENPALKKSFESSI